MKTRRAQKGRRGAYATGFESGAPHKPRRSLGEGFAGFTLIEILVVCGIIGIVCTIAIPMLHRQMHPDSMQQAVNDIMEACNHARAGAILSAAPVDLVLRAEDDNSMTISLQPAAGRSASPSLDSEASASPGPRHAAAGGIPSFSAKISDQITPREMELNFQDAMDWQEVRIRFYPNGTSDEFKLLLERFPSGGQSGSMERRLITLEVVTGLADVESDPNRMRIKAQ